MADKKESTEKKGGKGRVILIVAVALVVLVGGAFAFVELMMASEGESTDAVDPVAESVGDDWSQGTYQVPLLFVNLAETMGKRYLKVGCTVEFTAESPNSEIKRFEESDMAFRDALITLFSGKTIEEIDGGERKKLLKNEIRQVLAETMFPEGTKGRLDQVYYYEFLVQ